MDVPDFPGRLKALEPFWNGWYLDEQLGEGSFGKVFRIYREEFGKRTQAAMKWIPLPRHQGEVDSLRDSGMSDAEASNYYEELVREMQTEIMLMSSLRGSSHIVSLEDYAFIPRENEIGWDVLIRMELLQPLTKRLRSGMTVGDVARMGVDLCDALSLCGKKQIIHRDIKPDNIFVNEFGDYKLGDFGEARQLRREQTTMSVRGTPNYMAPEVYRGEKGDATLDQYSLGLVMHRLLNAQQLPFAPTFDRALTREEREAAFVQRIQGKPVPPPVQGSQRLKEAVCRACSHQPKKRYPTIEGFRADLEAALNDPECAEPLTRPGQVGEGQGSGGSSGHGPGTGKRPRWPFAVLGVMVAGMAVTGGMLLLGGDGGEADPTEPPAVTATATPEETEAPTEVPTPTPTATPWPYTSADAFETVLNENGGLTITRYVGTDAVVDIPPMIDGVPVTSIELWAFNGCESLTEVTIPEGVTSIGYGAFDGCSSLREIIIPAGVTSIGYGAFDGCSSLTSITIPDSVTSIGEYAFRGCSSLTSISIPAGVTSIEGWAFWGCSNLREIIIPAGVTSIGASAFYGCSSLTSITIPAGVTSIGDGAFYRCTSLTGIEIPEGVTSIGNAVFERCYSLENIDLPEGVTSIGSEAFRGCSSLREIIIPAGVTSIGDSAFDDCPALTIQTPSGSYAEAWATENRIPFKAIP